MSVRHPEYNSDNPITVGELAGKIREVSRFLKTKWRVILLLSFIGAIAGFAYSFKKTVYTAVSTFVLEENSKMGNLGQYAGLASLAGIDLNAQSGLFQGDNILELYKSRSMIEKALLSQGVFNNRSQLLIDRYIEYNHLRQRWKRNDQIDTINFIGDPSRFNRKQDSILTDITLKFNEKVLDVKKLDKKLSIIVVKVSTTDELFAKEFNLRLVATVNNFYIQTKTKKSYQNMMVLQHQADSVRAVLNLSIGGVAYATDATPNANPQLLSLKVPSQKKQIDVQASSAVYTEIVKNLEISKISLRQDVPLIQIIDEPLLPLEDNHISKVKAVLSGFILGAVISLFVLILKKVFSA